MYEQKKTNYKKQSQVIKEIKLSHKISDNDYNTNQSCKKFLQKIQSKLTITEERNHI